MDQLKTEIPSVACQTTAWDVEGPIWNKSYTHSVSAKINTHRAISSEVDWEWSLEEECKRAVPLTAFLVVTPPKKDIHSD